MDLLRPLLACLLAGGLLAAVPAALAGRVEIPLRVGLETIRQALAAQLEASGERPGEVLRQGRCTYLRLAPPQLERVEGRLRLSAPGEGAVGAELFGQCQATAAWQGTAHFTLEPRIDPDGRLRVRVADSRLAGPDGRSAGTAGLLWELGRGELHARLERYSQDLGASRAALVELVSSAAPEPHAAAMTQALERLAVGELRVEETSVVVPLALEVPDAWLVGAPARSPGAGTPLTEAEVEALAKALEPLDAFLVYSIRQAAAESGSAALRQRLFTLLLDTRYRLVEILGGEAPASPDPVRELLVETWSALREVLREAGRGGLLGSSVLRYALFVDAGDALVELERAAPGLNAHLSPGALRQLARTLRPASDDPLAYRWDDDAELRRLFDVEALPEPPPAAPLPSRTSLGTFIKVAADTDIGDGSIARKLDPWIPARDELALYEKRIGGLLRSAAQDELGRTPLAGKHVETYGHLVPTTALIESCWRQYVVRAGKATYLRSAAGSVGIMQINQRVWRGFYDVERLRWDTAYNIRAGARILMRYVKDYAIPFAQKSGDPTHVARAAYAVYNAGPRAVGRFAKDKPHPREARVDAKLWTLYQAIAAGGAADLRTCGVR